MSCAVMRDVMIHFSFVFLSRPIKIWTCPSTRPTTSTLTSLGLLDQQVIKFFCKANYLYGFCQCIIQVLCAIIFAPVIYFPISINSNSHHTVFAVTDIFHPVNQICPFSPLNFLSSAINFSSVCSMFKDTLPWAELLTMVSPTAQNSGTETSSGARNDFN